MSHDSYGKVAFLKFWEVHGGNRLGLAEIGIKQDRGAVANVLGLNRNLDFERKSKWFPC